MPPVSPGVIHIGLFQSLFNNRFVPKKEQGIFCHLKQDIKEYDFHSGTEFVVK